MTTWIRRLLLVAALGLPGSAGAAAPALVEGGTAIVRSVTDGDTVVLDRRIEGADEVRLVGIQAPKLSLGRPGFVDWPLAAEAKAAVEELAQGRTVHLLFGGRRLDRHGRLLAHLVVDGGVWVQGEMLGRGLARVYTFADNRARVEEMREQERRARSARRGIWGLRYYAVRSPETVGRDVGTFQLVEGVVADAAQVKGTLYLNFGADWRNDFTVTIDKPALPAFRQAGLDPLSLKARRIRVRGWVALRNGPMIEASHPEQIEVEPKD